MGLPFIIVALAVPSSVIGWKNSADKRQKERETPIKLADELVRANNLAWLWPRKFRDATIWDIWIDFQMDRNRGLAFPFGPITFCNVVPSLCPSVIASFFLLPIDGFIDYFSNL